MRPIMDAMEIWGTAYKKIEGIKKQHSPRQKLIELGGGCTILISQYLNQAHQAGQAQRQSRDVGDGQQGGNQCHKVGDQLDVTCSMET